MTNNVRKLWAAFPAQTPGDQPLPRVSRVSAATVIALLITLFLQAGTASGDEEEEGKQQTPRIAESLLQWSEHDPSAAVISRVRAQAELMKLDGNRMRALNSSDGLIAMQIQIDENNMRQIRNLKYANNQAWRNHRAWARLKNDPDLNEAAVRSGRALNFLLARLAVTALPYRFDPNDTRYSSGALAELRIEPDVFKNLTLQQQNVTFPASATTRNAIAYWPYMLRWQDFEKQRQDYELARERVVTEAQEHSEASVDAIQDMHQSLETFRTAFKTSSHAREWAIQNGRTLQYSRCLDFFVDLQREMKRLEQTGDLRPFQNRDAYNPTEDGDHLINLLSFMNRNGIRFAQAKPGSEFANQSILTLMRALYLTVEESDESTRGQTIQDRAREAMQRAPGLAPQKERLLPPE